MPDFAHGVLLISSIAIVNEGSRQQASLDDFLSVVLSCTFGFLDLSRNGFQDLSWKSVACGWKFVRASVRTCVRASVRPFIHL